MATLINLEGVRKKHSEAWTAGSINGFLTALRNKVAGTSAGDNGAINVWRDDSGNYRVSFMRFLCVKESRIFTNRKQVKKWLKEWFPKMHNA